MAKTKDALTIIDRLTGNDRELQQLIEKETINAQVTHLIYQARKKAGLTQQELADTIGAKQSVIARREDADYDGHSLTMLQRIAEALQQRIEIRFRPVKHTRRAA